MASRLNNLLELMNPVVKTFTKATWGFTLLNEGLEVVIQNLISELLKRFPGFSGSVGKIDVHPLSGRIEILDFRLKKKVTRERAEPFIFIPKVTLRLHWKDLIHTHIVGDIVMAAPVIFWDVQRWKPQTPPRPKAERRHDSTSTWQGQLKRMIPFHIENLVIKDGAVKISNLASQAEEDIHVHTITMRIRDLSNSPKLTSRRWTTVEAAYRVGSSGEGEWQAQGALLESAPLFTSRIKLRGFELSSVQNLIRHYFKVELTQGIFEIFAEAEAREGKFKGYADPVFHHLHLRPMRPSSLWRKLKTAMMQALVQLFRNKTTDQIATRIYFDGSFENPRVEWIAAIGNFLKNAFGGAFKSRLEPHFFEYFRRRLPAIISHG